MRKKGMLALLLCFILLTACGNEKTADTVSGTESSSQSTVQETSQTELGNEEVLYDNTATSSVVEERDTAREDAVADTKNADTGNSGKQLQIPEYTGQIDVDLTKLSSSMVYAEVFNMMVQPQDYVGKQVKMAGTLQTAQVYKDDGTVDPGKYSYACIIKDALACCSQGIQFVPEGQLTYPDDFPEDDTEILVIGRFETYEENGYTYCYLADAQMAY